MLTLTHTRDDGTVLTCPHPPAMVAAALRQIGWKTRTDGHRRLRGSAGRAADERRIRLTRKALHRRGFTVLPARTPAPGRWARASRR
ncbi:hypothetical protein [Streptacidiphilus jiangxiensis]|uniref:Uncharacterized protein n=1 Tax=Streptacidiphilus jiangxiensis TaxID=235985 RepID=A0A1H8AIK7_STRJI|nr:hypothetical protein [Streptacidiphilus jiangxiensis]SEM70336.1 hypothetical protein SAMN05414137_14531 [Streptacidiphilus jiangxiensis]